MATEETTIPTPPESSSNPVDGGDSSISTNNSIILDSRLMSKSDYKAEWEKNNPVLLKGEIGIELETDKWKRGDGVTTWNDLPYSKEEVFTKVEKDKLATVEQDAQENPFIIQSLKIKSNDPDTADDKIIPTSKQDKLLLSSINKIEIHKKDSTVVAEDPISGEKAHTLHHIEIGLSDDDVHKIDTALLRTGGTMTGKLTLNQNPTDDMEAATKKYVDDLLTVADIMQYKGITDSTHPLPTVDYKTGWSYKVAEAGVYHGYPCEVGDLIIAIKDWETIDSHDNWQVIQTNIDGAVTNAEANVVGNTVAIFDGTTGKIIKSSKLFLGLSIPPATVANKDSVLCIDAGGLATWRPINDIIDIATELKAGAVLSSQDDNSISVDQTTGKMNINMVTTDHLKNKSGTVLVLNGGTSSEVI